MTRLRGKSKPLLSTPLLRLSPKRNRSRLQKLTGIDFPKSGWCHCRSPAPACFLRSAFDSRLQEALIPTQVPTQAAILRPDLRLENRQTPVLARSLGHRRILPTSSGSSACQFLAVPVMLVLPRFYEDRRAIYRRPGPHPRNEHGKTCGSDARDGEARPEARAPAGDENMGNRI